MTTRICLGLLISSSKISLKPLLQRIASQLPDVTFHFSRFIVSDISGDQNSLQQFQSKMIIPTARFLADADVDIIGWMGTPSTATGIPATTSVLGLNKAFKRLSITEIGQVPPYTDDI
ncbi:unnamed protein product [Penicillium crustosum]